MLSRSDYISANNLDVKVIERCCGTLGLLELEHEHGWFYVSEDGEESAVIGVRDENMAPVCMAAWPIADPLVISTNPNKLKYPLLGAWNLSAAATWALGGVCRIYRSPVEWIREGCMGVVLLDYKHAVPYLRAALGPIVCEDAEQLELLEKIGNQPLQLGVWDGQG